MFKTVWRFHKKGFYHSDIKSANIMVEYNPNKDNLDFKLIDFGGTVTDY